MFEASENAKRRLVEMFDETLDQMIDEFRSGRRERQVWRVVPANTLTQVWIQHAELGVVRDEKAFERIRARIIENYVRLSLNTALAGHSEFSYEDRLGEAFPNAEEIERFINWAIDCNEGMRISDIAPNKMFLPVAVLIDAQSDSQALMAIDHILNIVHQRSDLAAWFVEGGQRTLSALSEIDAPSPGGHTL